MAVTQQKSVQVAAGEAVPVSLLPTQDKHGRVRVARFDFTQATANGDAGSLAELFDLPPGRVRLLQITTIWAALGTSRTLDLGWLAHEEGGTPASADPDGFVADINAASAGSATTVIDRLITSDAGLRVTAQVNDGTLDATKTIRGYALFVTD